jgi:hypothetical protein
MRRAARIDNNHVAIVDALVRVGAAVQSLATVGQGCPDLVVSRQGQTWLLEVKDGTKPPSHRTLTPDEREWHARWQAPVHVVLSVTDALCVVGVHDGCTCSGAR